MKLRPIALSCLALASLLACRDDAKKASPAPASPPPAADPAPAPVDPASTPPPSAATPPTADEAAAQLVHDAFADATKIDAAAALFPIDHKVTTEVTRGDDTQKASFQGLSGLRDMAGGGGVSMKLQSCKAHCCTFKPEFDDDRQLGLQLRKVCFDDARVVKSLSVSFEN